MTLKRGKRKWIWAGALLVICSLLVNPISHILFAVRIGLSLQKLASGAPGRATGVLEATIHRQAGTQSYDALTYRPAKFPATKAIVLVAGLSELGCYHPRLIALSKILADNGLFVITPDIREFRRFSNYGRAHRPDSVLVQRGIETGRRRDNTKDRPRRISFSATLALIAAAKPEIRDHVGFFVGIGPYSNLARCTRGWFAADPAAVPKRYYPTRFYAKWIVMRSALEMLASEKDRLFLRKVLDNLLRQKEALPADSGLTSEGARWYHWPS